MQRSGAQLDFQTVATLGFARESGLLGPEESGTLKQGLERLAGRQPFVDENPMPFCSDAVGILGVALGTQIARRQWGYLPDCRVALQFSPQLSIASTARKTGNAVSSWLRITFWAARIQLPASPP